MPLVPSNFNLKTAEEPWVCPVRATCPYEYDACTDPTKFCRIIEDTPEHYSQRMKGEVERNGGIA